MPRSSVPAAYAVLVLLVCNPSSAHVLLRPIRIDVLQTRWTDGPEGGAVLMLALLPVLALQGKASSGAAATYGLDQHGGCGHSGGSFVGRRVQYMAATCSVHRQR